MVNPRAVPSSAKHGRYPEVPVRIDKLQGRSPHSICLGWWIAKGRNSSISIRSSEVPQISVSSEAISIVSKDIYGCVIGVVAPKHCWVAYWGCRTLYIFRHNERHVVASKRPSQISYCSVLTASVVCWAVALYSPSIHETHFN